MNIFEMLYPRFYFDKSKPIRLFEAFSGVGCQAMALKRITDNIELVGISEIDKYAIQSYTAIHGEVKNYGDITKMETIPPCDIFTWSFPCTDLSKAGKQKGLTDTRSGLVYEVLRLLRETANYYPLHRHIPKNSKIHSMGLSTDYYQPIPDKSKLPKILIMENVPALVQTKFVKAFNDIQRQLEQLGYKNYNEVLNAKDYGIPQNRERIFMVSILGDYSYTFPEPIKLELRLKDLLEENVDEKYYLSEKMIKYISAVGTKNFKVDTTINKEIARPITTEQSKRARTTNYIGDGLPKEIKLVQVAQLDGFESSGRIYDENGLAPTINTMGGGQREPKIAIKTWNDETKAYKTKEADMPRDRIYTDESNIGFTITTNSNQQPFIMQKYRNFYDKNGYIPNAFNPYNESEIIDITPTLTSQSGSTTSSASILIKEATEKCYGEAYDDKAVIELISKNKRLKTLVENTNFSEGETKNLDIYNQKVSDISQTLTQPNHNSQALFHNLRIRKLTPLECWRLMGISDEDFYKAKASGMSNSQLYKQAGNGIVVNVFEAILKEMIK